MTQANQTLPTPTTEVDPGPAVHTLQVPSVSTDIFYSLGTLSRSTIGFIVSSWLLYFYVPPGGVPLVPVALYGVAVIFGRILGAALAPVIGYASDNLQSRWGRRLPFMFLAGLPVVVVFVLLWVPPIQNTSIWNLLYLTVFFGLFRAMLGLYQVPYEALLPEIAVTDSHRVRISAWQSSSLLIGMVIGSLAGLTIDKLGYFLTALIYGGFVLVAFYLPVFILRERKEQTSTTHERINFRRSLSITVHNRAFMLFSAAWGIYLLTTSLVQSSAPFIVTEVCRLNPSETIFFYLPGLFASLASYPLVTRLARHWGKRRVYAGSFLFAALVFPGTLLIGEWLPVSMKAQCISWAVLQAVAISGLVVLTTAFVAEITDGDFATTGQHRQGMYFATMNVLEQTATGIASILLPVLLLLGRSQDAPLGPLGVRLAGSHGRRADVGRLPNLFKLSTTTQWVRSP